MENPYKTLGVQQDTTIEQITLAYRRLSAKHHPDRNGGDTAKMQEINEAYALLSDEIKRAEWDETGGDPAIRAAREMLKSELKILLDLNRDGDFIKMLREQCVSKRARAGVARSHAAVAIKHLRKKLGSLKGPASGNFLAEVLETQIKNHEFGITQCDEALEVIAAAEVLLGGFSYTDPAQQSQDPMLALMGNPQRYGSPGTQWWNKD